MTRPTTDAASGGGPIRRRFETPSDLGDAAAVVIGDGIRASGSASQRYLLGCPGGRTPRVIFEALGRHCAQQMIDCSGVVIVMMDEYLEPGAEPPTTVSAASHNSCRRFGEFEIRQVINRGLPVAMQIPSESLWVPDPVDPPGYDARIAAAGGIELFLLASGASDGHVAFCGPGSDLDGGTSIVTLAPTTRADNIVTFPAFTSPDEVPTQGISVGLGTIRRQSRSTLMVLHGADKQESVRRIDACTRHDPAWPATFIHECPNAEIWTDVAANPAPTKSAEGDA